MALDASATLEAILFAAGEPLSRKRIAGLLGVTNSDLSLVANELRQKLAGSGLALMEANEEMELRTSADAADAIQKFRESELSKDLGRAGLETLAVILYKNGATRGEIDWVRGVNSTTALRSLMLRGLIAKTEDAKDRRKIRYAVTIDALAHLGISNANELPSFPELTDSLQENIAKDPSGDTFANDLSSEVSELNVADNLQEILIPAVDDELEASEELYETE